MEGVNNTSWFAGHWHFVISISTYCYHAAHQEFIACLFPLTSPLHSINTDECVTDECVADKCVTGKCVTGKCVTDECVTDKCVTDECVADECVTRRRHGFFAMSTCVLLSRLCMSISSISSRNRRQLEQLPSVVLDMGVTATIAGSDGSRPFLSFTWPVVSSCSLKT